MFASRMENLQKISRITEKRFILPSGPKRRACPRKHYYALSVILDLRNDEGDSGHRKIGG